MNPALLATQLLHARVQGLPVALPGDLGLADAWQVAALAEAHLRSQGRTPRGWKIGFTNRSIWPRYGVHQPIWGRVWDDTLTLLDDATADVSLSALMAPRLEPEIVFGLERDLDAGMDLADIVSCIGWVAHGVEIVHTHVGWQFDGPAAPVADFGLHGRLVVGPRRDLSCFDQPVAELAAMGLTLEREGVQVDRGQGANVLDGPLSALQAWVNAMAVQTPHARARAGDCVTTGTLTDAWPVAAGERWRTLPDDERLPGLQLRFTG